MQFINLFNKVVCSLVFPPEITKVQAPPPSWFKRFHWSSQVTFIYRVLFTIEILKSSFTVGN